MAKKGNQKNEQSAADQISAVEFTNQYNQDVEGFSVDLGLQVVDHGTTREVIAGISIEMGDGGLPAFIPADILRLLADEAEESARKTIARANTGRG